MLCETTGRMHFSRKYGCLHEARSTATLAWVSQATGRRWLRERALATSGAVRKIRPSPTPFVLRSLPPSHPSCPAPPAVVTSAPTAIMRRRPTVRHRPRRCRSSPLATRWPTARAVYRCPDWRLHSRSHLCACRLPAHSASEARLHCQDEAISTQCRSRPCDSDPALHRIVPSSATTPSVLPPTARLCRAPRVVHHHRHSPACRKAALGHRRNATPTDSGGFPISPRSLPSSLPLSCSRSSPALSAASVVARKRRQNQTEREQQQALSRLHRRACRQVAQ
jgi:hypothetical protein